MNNPILNQHFPLPDWRSDWLYALIFKEIDYWCSCSDPNCYVLIEEYASDDGSECTGSVIRAWVSDKHGMNEITLQEHWEHEKLRRGQGRFTCQYVLACFHVRPDRERFVFGWNEFPIGGNDGRYRVVGQMENAIIEIEGGYWIS